MVYSVSKLETPLEVATVQWQMVETVVTDSDVLKRSLLQYKNISRVFVGLTKTSYYTSDLTVSTRHHALLESFFEIQGDCLLECQFV